MCGCVGVGVGLLVGLCCRLESRCPLLREILWKSVVNLENLPLNISRETLQRAMFFESLGGIYCEGSDSQCFVVNSAGPPF